MDVSLEKIQLQLFAMQRTLHQLDNTCAERMRRDRDRLQEIAAQQTRLTTMEGWLTGAAAVSSAAFSILGAWTPSPALSPEKVLITPHRTVTMMQPTNSLWNKLFPSGETWQATCKTATLLLDKAQGPMSLLFRSYNLEPESKRSLLEQNNALSMDMSRQLQQQKEQLTSLMQRLSQVR